MSTPYPSLPIAVATSIDWVLGSRFWVNYLSFAIPLIRDMESGSLCDPNIVIYSTIIDSLCKDKLLDDVFYLFSHMKSRGISPTPLLP